MCRSLLESEVNVWDIFFNSNFVGRPECLNDLSNSNKWVFESILFRHLRPNRPFGYYSSLDEIERLSAVELNDHTKELDELVFFLGKQPIFPKAIWQLDGEKESKLFFVWFWKIVFWKVVDNSFCFASQKKKTIFLTIPRAIFFRNCVRYMGFFGWFTAPYFFVTRNGRRTTFAKST